MAHTAGSSALPIATLSLVLELLTAVGLTQPQQAQLLGLERHTLRRALQAPLPLNLSPEQLTRLRLSVEIATALRTLYADHSAGGWFGRPNGRAPFEGQTPLAYVLDGGTPALLDTHRLLLSDLTGQFSASAEARALAASLPQPEIDLDE
ncbi:antitoxin Xre-like helix-turn-helix domain-containing protein [Deinococcus arcticus]|uniref:Antitoxin Xre-like helix-turn-helix domain-containing protein n=1 Tax=Deinococcus arcticus TaxID=2136176 RepID=A0A2T3W577_9DEIO|nr:antitoxin Xre-like helix-turn-helix domain-containing protein [Deinococcus arcticus]PTA66944.1 hypothetical protein C8263_15365 [Deinococcus arcticus]